MKEATVAFDWAGKHIEVGDVFEDNNVLCVRFPSRFTTPQLAAANAAAGSTLGTVVKKIQVFDAAGASLGYLPVYDAIT